MQGSVLQIHAGEVVSEEFLPPLGSPPEPSVFTERKDNIHRIWHKKEKGPGMELEEDRMGEDFENYSLSHFYLKY